MYDQLQESQASVYVTSATAKVLVIKREDKSFLNVALKESIDRLVMEMEFKDFDRPVKN